MFVYQPTLVQGLNINAHDHKLKYEKQPTQNILAVSLLMLFILRYETVINMSDV